MCVSNKVCEEGYPENTPCVEAGVRSAIIVAHRKWLYHGWSLQNDRNDCWVSAFFNITLMNDLWTIKIHDGLW